MIPYAALALALFAAAALVTVVCLVAWWADGGN